MDCSVRLLELYEWTTSIESFVKSYCHETLNYRVKTYRVEVCQRDFIFLVLTVSSNTTAEEKTVVPILFPGEPTLNWWTIRQAVTTGTIAGIPLCVGSPQYSFGADVAKGLTYPSAHLSR